MDGVGIFVAELIEDGGDPGVILRRGQLTDDTLEPGKTAGAGERG